MNLTGFFTEAATAALNLACTIQAIPAPTFNESQRSAYFLRQFKTLGLEDVQQDSAGNVLARLPGQNPGKGENRLLVVSAHLDTVHPLNTPLTLRRAEDRLTGPGIGDNALGLAALLMLPHLLKAPNAQTTGTRLPGDIWLVANVCEEGLGDLRGMQAVVDRFKESPLAYLVVEGMGMGTILHRGLGVERYKISVQTPGGHSWVDYGQPSAIHELCNIVTKLAAIPVPQFPCSTLNVGKIQGGTSVNTIAANAWLELDLRSEESAVLAKLVQQTQAAAQATQKRSVEVRVERIGKREAGHIPADHPLVELAVSVLADLGIEPHLDIASTDANLPLSRGFPSICVGITLGSSAHTTEEFIQTQPVAKGLAQLYELVTRAWDKLGG